MQDKSLNIVCVFLGLDKRYFSNFSNKINFNSNFSGIYKTKNSIEINCIWALGHENGFTDKYMPTISSIKSLVEDADLVLAFGLCGSMSNNLKNNFVVFPNQFYNYGHSDFLQIINFRNQPEKVLKLNQVVVYSLNSQKPILIENFFNQFKKNIKNKSIFNTKNLTVPYITNFNSLESVNNHTKRFFLDFADTLEMELYYLINMKIKKIGIYLHVSDMITSNPTNFSFNPKDLDYNIDYLVEKSVEEFIDSKKQ